MELTKGGIIPNSFWPSRNRDMGLEQHFTKEDIKMVNKIWLYILRKYLQNKNNNKKLKRKLKRMRERKKKNKGISSPCDIQGGYQRIKALILIRISKLDFYDLGSIILRVNGFSILIKWRAELVLTWPLNFGDWGRSLPINSLSPMSLLSIAEFSKLCQI